MHKPSDPIGDLAVTFAEQNRYDQASLRNQLDSLRFILAAIVNQEGGTYLLSDLARFGIKPDAEVFFRPDPFNRCLVIKISVATETEPTAATQDRSMPYWML